MGSPAVCPHWVSWECLLHVSQLLLPPTTSSRTVLASGVTAMPLTAESQHCDSPGTCKEKKSTIFIGTDSFCIDDLFYYEHALTSVPVYFYKQPHLQSMDADMSRIRVGNDMDFLSFIYSVLWTDIYKKGYFKCVNSAVNVELSEFKSIYTHSWHCI